jgi:thioesterase domain-containing protein
LEQSTRFTSACLHRSLTSRSLLQGWSFGGLVSLQIARLLDDERQHGRTEHGTQPLFVAGVVLIDSPYTLPWREHRDRFVDFKPEFPTWTPEQVRKKVTRRFEVSDELVFTWEPPRWGARLDQSVEGGTLLVNASDSSDQRSATKEEGPRVRPVSSAPPVVLLKAMARVSLTKSKSDGPVDVDLCRDDPLLGWERYAGDLLETVHPVSGHHFDLFDQEDRARLDPFTIVQRKPS